MAERFGEGIFAFGPFIVHSAARHLERERTKLTQGGDDAASSAAPPAASETTLEEDVGVLKAASHFYELRAHEPGAPERSDAATHGSLKSMLERCSSNAPNRESARRPRLTTREVYRRVRHQGLQSSTLCQFKFESGRSLPLCV